MAIYKSNIELKGSNAPTGLGVNYSTQGKLATFDFPVNGKTIKTYIEVDSAGGKNSVNLVGPDGRPLAYYDATTNKWNAPPGQGNSSITQIIIPKISSTPGLANALSQSAYYTAYHRTSSRSKATEITGISPSTAPPAVAPPAQGLDGSSSQNQQDGGGLLGIIGDLVAPGLGKITNLNLTSVNEDRLFGDENAAFLKYPRDILDKNQDTLQITMYNYKAPLGDTFLPEKGNRINTKKIFTKGLQRNSALKKRVGTVILPIPNGIQDSNAVSWGDDQMNNMTAGVASYMINSLNKAAIGQLAAYGGNETLNAFKGINLPMNQLIQLATLYDADALKGNNPLIKSAFISQLMKNAQYEISPETILARAAGIVPNSNMELLFQGPTLRQFGFNWRMSPRSEREAKNVKRIIRFFKQGSAARKVNSSSGAGANSFFFGSPNVFKLSYKTGNEEISGLNKFKICALVNMSVVYAPDGQWAAYEKGQPVSVTMSLNFQEIEPVYESDYQGGGEDGKIFGGLENDNPKVYPDDVGY